MHLAQRHGIVFGQIEIIGKIIKSLVDAPLGVQDIGGEETGGGEAPALQGFTDQLQLAGHQEAAVVAHLVIHGVGPGQDGGMGRQGEGGLGDAGFEMCPFGGQAVEIGRLHCDA